MMKKIINLKGKTEEEARNEFMKVTAEIWNSNSDVSEMSVKPGNNKLEVVYK